MTSPIRVVTIARQGPPGAPADGISDIPGLQDALDARPTEQQAIALILDRADILFAEAASDAEQAAAFEAGAKLVFRTDDPEATTTTAAPGTTTTAAPTTTTAAPGTTTTTTAAPTTTTTTTTAAPAVPPNTTTAPFVAGLTSDGATLYAKIDATGTGYCLVLPAADPTPSPATVKATGVSFAMTANVLTPRTLTGQSASTAVKAHFVAESAGGALQAAVQSVAFTTDIALTPIFADPCDSIAGWTAHQSGWNADGQLFLNNAGGGSSWGYRTVPSFSTNGGAGVRRRLSYDVTVQAWAAGTGGIDHTAFYLGFSADASLSAVYADWYVVGLGYAAGGNGFTAFNNMIWDNLLATADVAAGRTYRLTIDIPGNGTIVYKIWDKALGVEASHTQTATRTLTCVFANLFGTTPVSPLIDNIAFSSY